MSSGGHEGGTHPLYALGGAILPAQSNHLGTSASGHQTTNVVAPRTSGHATHIGHPVVTALPTHAHFASAASSAAFSVPQQMQPHQPVTIGPLSSHAPLHLQMTSTPLPLYRSLPATNTLPPLVPPIFQNCRLRSGKWFVEEERYAELLIEMFEKGNIKECQNGNTLRSFLSRKLHCAPMRISKKYAGKGIGKMVYLEKPNNPKEGSKEASESVAKLRKAESDFYRAAFPNVVLQAAEASLSGMSVNPTLLGGLNQLVSGGVLNFTTPNTTTAAATELSQQKQAEQLPSAPHSSSQAKHLQQTYLSVLNQLERNDQSSANRDTLGAGLSLPQPIQPKMPPPAPAPQPAETPMQPQHQVNSQVTPHAASKPEQTTQPQEILGGKAVPRENSELSVTHPITGASPRIRPRLHSQQLPHQQSQPPPVNQQPAPPSQPKIQQQFSGAHHPSSGVQQQQNSLHHTQHQVQWEQKTQAQQMCASHDIGQFSWQNHGADVPDFLSGFDHANQKNRVAPDTGGLRGAQAATHIPANAPLPRSECHSPPFTSRSFDDFHRLLGKGLSPLHSSTTVGCDNKPNYPLRIAASAPETQNYVSADSYVLFAQESVLAASQHSAYLRQGGGALDLSQKVVVNNGNFEQTKSSPEQVHQDEQAPHNNRLAEASVKQFSCSIPKTPIGLSFKGGKEKGRIPKAGSQNVVSASEPSGSEMGSMLGSSRGSGTESSTGSDDNDDSNSDEGPCPKKPRVSLGGRKESGPVKARTDLRKLQRNQV